MTSLVDLRGSGVPSLSRLPDEGQVAGSLIELVEEFCEAHDFVLLPWQRLVLKNLFSYKANGKWVSSSWGLSVPRQNGKNFVIMVREIFGMVFLGEKILHTAHQVKTGQNDFARLRRFFNSGDFPEMCALVENISSSMGRERILLKNGGEINFVARSKNSARGFTVDVLVSDEAQHFSEDALSALLPTTASGPLGNKQVIFTGTPPNESAESFVFENFRSNALDVTLPFATGWLEWSAGLNDDPSDPDVWVKGNPSLGYVMDAVSLLEDSRIMAPLEFARERLGVWCNFLDDTLIHEEDWVPCTNQVFVRDKSVPIAVGVDVNPLRNRASIAVAGLCDDQTPFIELVEYREGTVDWVPKMLKDICLDAKVRCVSMDSLGNASTFIDPLGKDGFEVNALHTRDVTRACGEFYDAVMTGGLYHLSQPPLTAAVLSGRKRAVGDTWVWARGFTQVDVTPLIAATFALFGLQASKVVPVKKTVMTSAFF